MPDHNTFEPRLRGDFLSMVVLTKYHKVFTLRSRATNHPWSFMTPSKLQLYNSFLPFTPIDHHFNRDFSLFKPSHILFHVCPSSPNLRLPILHNVRRDDKAATVASRS